MTWSTIVAQVKMANQQCLQTRADLTSSPRRGAGFPPWGPVHEGALLPTLQWCNFTFLTTCSQRKLDMEISCPE